MKRFFNKKTATILSIFTLVILATPFTAHAVDWFDFLMPQTYINKLLELVVLPLAGGALALVGNLLDVAIKFSLGTGYIYGSLTVINESWAIIRDICNLFFIFALIWISISIILSLSSFNAKRHLTQLIIAALIINFSLYFTKVFIDVSNIFGNWLYSGIFNLLAANKASSSISALIAMKFEIFRLWESPQNIIWDPQSSILSTAMRLLVTLVATYVFMYTTILFLTRAVTIIFLLILSPIGFVGGLLPKLEEYSKKWWSELVDAATFPVIYLLLLYISFQLINSMDSTNIWAGFTASNGSSVIAGVDIGKTFKYIIVISALLISLKVAKDSAGQLGKAASGIAGGLSKFSTAVGGGGAALLGQYTIGAGAARLANNKWLSEKIAGGGVIGAVASSAKSQLGTAADFHFDPRTTISEFGVKGGKGYTSRRKEQLKAQEEAIKDIAPSKDDLETVKSTIDLAEDRVYKTHTKYGKIYDDKKSAIKKSNDVLNDTKSTASEREAALKVLNKSKSDLGDIKKIIDDDKEFKDSNGLTASEQIYAEKVKMMELADRVAKKARAEGRIRDAEGQEKRRDAMNSILSQDRAIKAAGSGPLVSLAKPFDKSFKDMSLGAKTATILTGGLAMAAGRQIAGDTKKDTKKLRETVTSKTKDEQDKITKMLAKLAGGEEAEAPKPAAGTTSTSSGSSTGSSSTGTTSTGSSGGKTP